MRGEPSVFRYVLQQAWKWTNPLLFKLYIVLENKIQARSWRKPVGTCRCETSLAQWVWMVLVPSLPKFFFSLSHLAELGH